MPLKVFVDSDVVISSLISKKGAAYFLLNAKNLEYFISDLSIKEQEIVVDRLNLDLDRFKNLIKNRFKIVDLKVKAEKVKGEFGNYVLDINDAHIVAGSEKAGVRFLITYNLKDYSVDKIKKDFDIVVTSPANLLQYLRSRED